MMKSLSCGTDSFWVMRRRDRHPVGEIPLRDIRGTVLSQDIRIG